MPSLFDLNSIWKTFKEIDLRPIRAEAEQETSIAIVSADQAAARALAQLVCQEKLRPLPESDASKAGPEPLVLTPSAEARALTSDLVVLLLTSNGHDLSSARELFQAWQAEGKRVIAIADPSLHLDPSQWQGAPTLRGATRDVNFIENVFVPAALEVMPDRHLSLARHYPLFRLRAAQQLISETSIANASYSFSTGLAEIIPILDIPFNVADMIVLTKAQAMMAYKLGLALGLSTRWQDHMAAFGGTIGSGFILRQLARGLVGIVPIWGIIPKVAVAYAGTYVMGQAILQWYKTGRQVTPEMMRQLYRDAFTKGKEMAQSLMSRNPRGPRRLRLASGNRSICANCGATNTMDFHYCGNCGSALKAAS